MRVKIVKVDENNMAQTSIDSVTMKEAREWVKTADKTGLVKIYAKWFGEWHYHSRMLWERKEAPDA